MELNLTFWAISALAVGAAGWVLAAVVYRSGPTRPVNRSLAFLLVSEGALVGTIGTHLVSGSPANVHAWTYVHAWTDMLVAAAYLIFIGQALRTPLVAPLRSRWVQGGLVASLGAGTVLLLAFPSNFTPGIFAFPIPSFTLWVTGIGPWWPVVWIVMTVAFAYGFVAAVHAWRTAPDGPARQRARAYVAAFGVRDIGWAFVFTSHAIVGTTDPAWFAFILELQVFTVLAYLLLLGYGLLKTQLFDIDLKLKAGIRGSTVTGAFVGAFFLASETIEQVLPLDGTVFGVLAAAAVALAIRPVQGFAERVANRALPGVEDTPAYRQQRRIELYQAALSEAIEPEGEISAPERARLKRLRDKLGLTEQDHELLLSLAVDRPGDESPDAILAGRAVLGRYDVQKRLGEGGQGEAFLARDTDLGEDVVLKVLSASSRASDALEEVQALIDLDDPHVLGLRAVEEIDGRLVLVLDLAEGGTLIDALEEGPLDEDELDRLADGLLSGLKAIHDAGLIHRDVKPSNVFRMADGRWVVGDLGIAHRLSDDATVATMTTHGQPGTARYMSPEQAKGQPVDHRTDLFSAGLVLYEAATSEPLIETSQADSAIEVRMRLAAWQGLDAAGDPPHRLTDVLTRALARDPEDRFEDAGAMRASIEATTGTGRDRK